MINTAADAPSLPGYAAGTQHADDRRAYAWGYAHQLTPALHVGMPFSAGPYHNAGPAPTMGFIGAIADAVSGVVDVIAGGPQKRERAARAEAAALEAQAQAMVDAARIEAQSSAQRAQSQTTMLLIGGGMALAAVVLVMAMKKK